MELELVFSDLDRILRERTELANLEIIFHGLQPQNQQGARENVDLDIVLLEDEPDPTLGGINILDESAAEDPQIRFNDEVDPNHVDESPDTITVQMDDINLGDAPIEIIEIDTVELPFDPNNVLQQIDGIKLTLHTNQQQLNSIFAQRKQARDSYSQRIGVVQSERQVKLGSFNSLQDSENKEFDGKQTSIGQQVTMLNSLIQTDQAVIDKWGIIATWLPVFFRKYHRNIASLRTQLGQLNNGLQAATAARNGMVELYKSEMDRINADAIQEHNNLTLAYHSLDRTLLQTAQQIYHDSVGNLLPEYRSLLRAWLEYLAEKLQTWHPNLGHEFWEEFDEEHLVRRTQLQNPGLRVGTLMFPDSDVVLPAILDPIGNKRHVFIRGGQADRRSSLMHILLLRLVMAFPVGLARLVLIDSTDQGRALNLFGTKLNSDLSGGDVFDQDNKITEQLQKVRERISQINRHVLVEHTSIDQYNQANPEIPTPYQFIAISNFPDGLNDQALDALSDILRNGPQAGVFIIATINDRQPANRNFNLHDFIGDNYLLVMDNERTLRWNSEHLKECLIQPDDSRIDIDETKVIEVINQIYSKKPILVEYERVRRGFPDLWRTSTASVIKVPIGLTFGGKLHEIEFSDAYVHGLIGGRTGSGKTVLLHDLIVGLAQIYSPEELELYLLDFRGNEFDVYAKNKLPHARVVAIDCDTEVGLDVLNKLLTEMNRRYKLFSDSGGYREVKDYRAGGHKLTRILLIIDEFQLLVQQASDMNQTRQIENGLVDLLRRGRAAGIHLLLGTQSPTNTLTGQMLQQIAIRVCLQADQQVSRLVLGESNEAASDLQKPGEAVYNAYNGDAKHNVMMRAALISKEHITQIVQRLAKEAETKGMEKTGKMFFFDGQIKSTILDHPLISKALASKVTLAGSIFIPLGCAIGPGEDITIRLSRERYGNILVIGSEPEKIHSLFCNLLLSICIQVPYNGAQFFLIDLTYADLPYSEKLRSFQGMPQEFQFARSSETGCDLIAEVYKIYQERKEEARGGTRQDHAVFLAIFGAENFSDLRGVDKYDKTETRKRLEELLKEGPQLGVHCLVATQSLAKGEIISHDNFGMRICFPIAEDDSRALLDNDSATKLRADRAIFRKRDAPPGKVDKFKPYLDMDEASIRTIQDQLLSKEDS